MKAPLRSMTSSLNDINIRTIQPQDNAAIAKVIRAALEEFGAAKPGTVYFDASTDALYQLFQQEGSVYYIAEKENEILGGGGIYPTAGLPQGTCELVKMYLQPKGRGIGLGKKLIEQSLQFAHDYGYRQVYLETMPELKQALTTYAKFGFEYLNGPLGNSGHHGCELWMLKTL